MSIKSKTERRTRTKHHIRKRVEGTAVKPRLSVFRSLRFIYAQLIDDETGKTIVAATSEGKKSASITGKKSDVSKEVGKTLAEKAIASGVKQVVFDRNGYRYHGRVKALAEGAREGGLQF
ncbi:MAG: 50S ribosomal protein L18 [Rhizobacter sp.]|nr:50S ribosomal protein L18 [Chlorobiales bacterium]